MNEEDAIITSLSRISPQAAHSQIIVPDETDFISPTTGCS